ncbi:DUF4917 family protein [Cellulomonas rhizosphaerae]|uniref:DUF4917 family protein n=1 Tax=Cellulomonas rhizosphaerae TaxID=2293719 RepID=A0A413RHQ4_9CELL|nr:DUF4917 family protein [Cellulomonas rhizosphaerae]RHA37748.1 DUF4917 family protein [Cellulomonas rhizosphaerae]
MTTAIDSDLQSWLSLQEDDWPTLLVGNGLSINLWAGFSYSSLYQSAALTTAAQSIFNELGTTNFEQCLECLHHANIALSALNESTAKVDQTYEDVRDALFTAVGLVHVPWERFPQDAHDALAVAINGYDAVFTTNYDLSLYWSQMQTTKVVDIVDYFWAAGHQFDPADTAVRSSRSTRMHYLHGGIHLWQDNQTGENGKWTSGRGRLLDIQGKYGPGIDRRPLFVSEGTAAAKARTIRQSTYLSFCLEQLRMDDKPTVVFGQSLADQDRHVVAALMHGPTRRIAVSMYPTTDDAAVIAEKARILGALGRHKVEFFDSTSYPIGAPSLLIPAP